DVPADVPPAGNAAVPAPDVSAPAAPVSAAAAAVSVAALRVPVRMAIVLPFLLSALTTAMALSVVTSMTAVANAAILRSTAARESDMALLTCGEEDGPQQVVSVQQLS